MSKLDEILIDSGAIPHTKGEVIDEGSWMKVQIKNLVLEIFDGCIGGGRTYGETIDEFTKKVKDL